MAKKPSATKAKILEVLAHPEASEGLYFRNFYQLHEEDERDVVPGSPEEILAAVYELVDEGKVRTGRDQDEMTFHIETTQAAAER
jgi:hypothetical protein